MTAGIEPELDRLFRLPLSEFVVARNTLAASLKSGDPEASARVKEIPKPSPSAWAVNQLYWRARPVFEALLAAGDEHRGAQAEALRERDTDRLLAAERNRSIAIEETVRRIVAIFDDDGQPAASPAVLGRIATTLEALATYGTANPEPMKGRLTSDLEPPGFAALAPLVPPLPPAAAAEPERGEEERAAAKQRVLEAEKALAAAWAELDRARQRVEELEARVEEARCRLQVIEALLESGEAARERS